jgi:endo-1,4-beta-D-glucanase Y
MSNNRIGFFQFATIGALGALTSQACSTVEPDPSVLAEQSISIAPANGASTVQSAYTAWKAAYIVSSGSKMLVKANATSDSYSEAIGYGMLLAAYLNDRATFDGLWSYAKSFQDANGLMHWWTSGFTQVLGQGSASSADEDMAIALMVAEKRWSSSYGSDARTLINRILANDTASSVLKPGDTFSGPINPSYLDPGYYTTFATYTGNTQWNTVAATSYTLLGTIQNATTGLVPDWSTSGGTPYTNYNYNYGYEACRSPWRLAHDYQWYGNASAKVALDRINAFWKQTGATRIVDGYTLLGAPTGTTGSGAFIGMAAAGAVASTDPTFTAAMWNAAVNSSHSSYYPDTLRTLGLLSAAGMMPSPLTIGTSSCTDGLRNGSETDVDCGGTCAADCANGRACVAGSDCLSGVCTTGICRAASCTDGLRNGSETDVDCGGTCAADCANGRACAAGSDCLSGVCTTGICRAASCTDGLRNGSETDVDCGGTCAADCANGRACAAGSDCLSGVCTTGICRAASCTDGLRNGSETDVDCGGACAADCANGRACTAGSDCVSGVCTTGICGAASGAPTISKVSITSDWASGYCVNVDVTNSGPAVTAWTVRINLNQSTLNNAWNANTSVASGIMTASSTSSNGALATNATTQFGFCGNKTGTNWTPTAAK